MTTGESSEKSGGEVATAARGEDGARARGEARGEGESRAEGEGRGRDESRGPGAPAVSVIVPAYKAARFIGETLDSVFAQTFRDFEVVVVNDGSPDTEELERVLEPYRGRLTYVTQENQGAGAARNRGLREARAPLVAFLDADDVWLPTFLEEQLAFMRGGDYDLVYSNALLFGDTPAAGLTYMDTASPSEGEVNFVSLIHYRCNVITSGSVARRQPIIDAGLFDEGLRNSQDFDLWVRLVRRGARVGYQRKVLLRYRCHPESLSSGDPVSQVQRQLRVFEKMERTAEGLSPVERAELAKALERLRAELDLEVGKRHLARGEFAAARASLAKANQYRQQWKLRAVLLLLRLAPRLVALLYRRARA